MPDVFAVHQDASKKVAASASAPRRIHNASGGAFEYRSLDGATGTLVNGESVIASSETFLDTATPIKVFVHRTNVPRDNYY